jgi:hypothetical protein
MKGRDGVMTVAGRDCDTNAARRPRDSGTSRKGHESVLNLDSEAACGVVQYQVAPLRSRLLTLRTFAIWAKRVSPVFV